VTSTRWERLNQLFHDALACPAERRAAWLEDACGDDADLVAELTELLASHGRDEGLMERPAIAAAPDWLQREGGAVGQRFGPWRITRELGRGGMGAVYLAERADGAFEQRVALKLVKRGMDSEHVLARFRSERQILAGLEHPNIARLLDGGASDEGQPFLVMEYIEGQRIDEFARAHRLSVADRLRLWLPVASAVSYAHQHLVVHRDIKPANILVTADGTPKLLDFGIARLLDPAAEVTSTVTELRMLTPEYASPEQIEGRHTATTTDVYSLGVVLYELLTGRSPYRARSRSPRDIADAITTTEPVRPSVAAAESDPSLARRLRGDLDTILLTALRKEAARRYPSVERFAGDVRRHLEGLPVRARPDTIGYRTGKFVRRHQAGVAAAVLVGLALIGGIVGTAWQARQAQAAQALAERRFNDVRALAHSVLFDYHDAIEDLPGSTPIRERLVRDGLRYLDTLAREAHGDRSLQRELAGAYRRVGDVQGGTLNGNLGDTPGALESYGKAERILQDLLSADSTDTSTRRELARILIDRGHLRFDTGDVPGAQALARQAETTLAPLARGPLDSDLRLELGDVDDLLGVLLLETGEARASVMRHRVAIARLEAAPAAEQRTPALRRALSVAYHHLADAEAQIDGSPAALASYQRARAIRAGLVAEFPDNTDYRHLQGASDYWIGEVLADMGRYREALQRFRSGLVVDSVEVRRDPRNSANWSGLAFSLARIGEMELKLHEPGQALASWRQSLVIRARQLGSDSTNLFKRFQVVEGQSGVCTALAALGPERAEEECSRAASLMRGMALDSSNAGYRGYLAGAYSDLAAIYDSMAVRGAAGTDRHRRRVAALDLYQESAAIWSDLAARRLVNPTDTGRVTAARAAVSREETAVARGR
jgi:non-specific serine/threonine protein kinase/serine/threonine-protein kinase